MAQPARQAATDDDARQTEPALANRETVPAADLSALMRSCRWAIEEERLHELRVPAANGVPAYVELSVAAEGIFSNGNQAAALPDGDDDIKRFIAAFGVSLLCYGYPYLQYADGSIRPLFLMRVKIEDGNLCPDPKGYLKVNSWLSGLHPHPLGLEWAQTGYRGARHGCSRPRRSPIPAFATRVPATFPR